MKILQQGIARVRALHSQPPVRLPITASLVLKIKSSLEAIPKAYDSTMLYVACYTAFFGFLGCAEFQLSDDGHFDRSIH